MIRIPFTKAHGAKNDFVIVDDRTGRYDNDTRRRFAQDSAHRRTGVGSDGTIFIDASATCDFRMDFYNPDGSAGSMCGNGGRCAALFAFARGIAQMDMRFEVLGRGYAARILPDAAATTPVTHGTTEAQVLLSFPPPLEIRSDVLLETDEGVIIADYIDTGAPHLLVFAHDLPEALRADFDALDMERIGPPLRHHERFSPRGCNVNLLTRDGDGHVRIRTFEKGVEAETWACGTGTLAAGMVAHRRLGIPPPVRLRTHGNDMLTVHFSPDTTAAPNAPAYFAHELALEGPAVLVFEGNYEL
jgi:diaminopimelate epimerase